MSAYRKILSIIDLAPNGERVARRALELARLYNATLAAATVIDYAPGYDSDHAPFLTPGQVRDALVQQFSGKLARLLERIGAAGSEGIVAVGAIQPSVADVVQSWQPDLVVVGSHQPFGLDQPKSLFGRRALALPFDVLVTQIDSPKPLGGRLVHALARAFC